MVEVDVVAQGGLLWIECKAERGRVATGLVQQALALKEVANAPCNLRPFGIAPRVAAFVTGDMGDFEAQTLRDAGILILHAGGESGSAALDPGAVLPPPPSAPTVANLDITALFALVSEVSAATTGSFAMFLDDPLVREWAAKKPQHASCLAAELEDPLNLEITLQSYDRLVAHPSVLRRFRKILDTMGGPREKNGGRTCGAPRVESYDAFEDVAAPTVEGSAADACAVWNASPHRSWTPSSSERWRGRGLSPRTAGRCSAPPSRACSSRRTFTAPSGSLGCNKSKLVFRTCCVLGVPRTACSG